MDFKLNKSLHVLVSFNLLILLLFSVWIMLLFGYYYFSPHSPQQDEIFTYLLNHQSNGLLNADYLNVAEKRHLLDVKRLFIKTEQLFQYCILSYCILWLLFYKRLSRSLLQKILLTMGFMLVTITTVLGSILGFDALFTLLHSPFFLENTWLFSKESTLIQLFPSEYFYHFSLIYAIIITMILFLIKNYKSITLFPLDNSPNL